MPHWFVTGIASRRSSEMEWKELVALVSNDARSFLQMNIYNEEFVPNDSLHGLYSNLLHKFKSTARVF